MLLCCMLLCMSPPATVLPPPATAQENTNVLNTQFICCPYFCYTAALVALTKKNSIIPITYCSSVHKTMMRTHPITHITSTVATVCCLWLVATTASRSACSHLTPTKPAWHLQHGWTISHHSVVQSSHFLRIITLRLCVLKSYVYWWHKTGNTY